MFGNVTALMFVNVTALGNIRLKHDAHMLQACSLGSSHEPRHAGWGIEGPTPQS